ncbi:MAG: protein kinase [Desulfobacterales bacterium]|nr:protein kinase [Desulfobacterales bacterium]
MSVQGQIIKQFKVLRPLGKGGMGEVWLAEDTILKRKVAIKFLPPNLQDDITSRERFLREALAAAALDHPFICKIYETGEVDGKAYIVMEYIEGQDLKVRMQGDPLPMKEILRIILEIAEALAKAHANGIVHRDLKPANIMITPDNRVKIMDFGLAKRVTDVNNQDITSTMPAMSNEGLSQDATLVMEAPQSAELTQQGMIVGTVAYMSPEQGRGEEVDGRSDIFSLGVILYELATKKHPFLRSTPLDTLKSVIGTPHPPLKMKQKRVSSALSPILNKTLAKNVEKRYQSIVEFIKAIEKMQKVTHLGSPLFYLRWQAIVSLVAIVGVIAFGVSRYSRKAALASQVVPDPVSVLVADFQNLTGNDVFNGAVEQAMNIGLEGASFITAFKRPDARSLAGDLVQDFDGVLDSEMAQLICRSEGISIFIDGLIEPKGDGFSVKIWARDPTNPENVTELTKNVSTKGDVLNAAAWLANKLRKKLGDISTDARAAMSGETFTTASLEAMNAYTSAQELYRKGKEEEAITAYLSSIGEDPDFGRAYSALAMVYQNRGQYEEAENYFQEAISRIDRMTEREKFRTYVVYYLVNSNYDQAIKEATQLVEKYPADITGFSNLAIAYFYTRNFEKAKEMGQHAVDLNPKEVQTRFNLSWYALAASDLEVAKEQAQSIINENPDFYEVYVVLALSNLAQENIDEASRIYGELRNINPIGASLADLGLADIALYEGRLSDTVNILENRLNFDRLGSRTEFAGNKLIMLSKAHILRGETASAIRTADQAATSSRQVGTQYRRAILAIQTGDEEKAKTIVNDLSKRLSSEAKAYAKLIEGKIAEQKDEIRAAIDHYNASLEILDMWLTRLALGKAYLKIEAWTEAHAELDQCKNRLGEATSIFFDDTPTFHTFPQVYYYLGLAQQGIGSRAAVESFQKFLSLKENADWDDPMVKDAQQRFESLN